MPPKRRWTSQDDPRLHTPEWLAIRRHWQLELKKANANGGALYCQAPRCKGRGVPIQEGGRRGRWHLDVGHIISRELDDRQVWQISDTRPEHSTCNRSAGVEVGRRKAAARKASTTRPELAINRNDW